nr:hypothetical protein Iba_scaffold17857CG0010 [Ipomoea batatas]
MVEPAAPVTLAPPLFLLSFCLIPSSTYRWQLVYDTGNGNGVIHIHAMLPYLSKDSDNLMELFHDRTIVHHFEFIEFTYQEFLARGILRYIFCLKHIPQVLRSFLILINIKEGVRHTVQNMATAGEIIIFPLEPATGCFKRLILLLHWPRERRQRGSPASSSSLDGLQRSGSGSHARPGDSLAFSVSGIAAASFGWRSFQQRAPVLRSSVHKQQRGIAPLLLCFAGELVAAVEAEDDDDGPPSRFDVGNGRSAAADGDNLPVEAASDDGGKVRDRGNSDGVLAPAVVRRATATVEDRSGSRLWQEWTLGEQGLHTFLWFDVNSSGSVDLSRRW